MKLKEKIFILAGLLVPTGCIKEDFSDCPQGKYIWFESINERYDYADIAENLSLYVYDESRELAATHHYTRMQLQEWGLNAFIPPPGMLPGGTYTVVALLNPTAHYEITGQQNLDDFLFSLAITENDTVLGKPDDIYHAQQQVVFVENVVTRDTMRLSKNTNYINLSVEFINSPLPQDANIEAFISGTNGSYNYRNIAVGNQKLVYESTPAGGNNGLNEFEFKILRIWIGDDLILRLVQHQTGLESLVLKEIMLTEEIAKIQDDSGDFPFDTDEELDREDIFDIKITLQGDDLTVVAITVNNWSSISPETGI